ncbi:3629_t:CDS:2 [Entrophospora sp. SA101]|nr:3629_t:CDS:2 [Entrophospora sp. SA101]CAJ0827276.1 6358_t:CDS:2 [Entrophospora sp. SA101]
MTSANLTRPGRRADGAGPDKGTARQQEPDKATARQLSITGSDKEYNGTGGQKEYKVTGSENEYNGSGGQDTPINRSKKVARKVSRGSCIPRSYDPAEAEETLAIGPQHCLWTDEELQGILKPVGIMYNRAFERLYCPGQAHIVSTRCG